MIILTLLALSLTSISQSEAREMQGRLGMGYNSEFARTYPSPDAGPFASGGLPSLSVKYGWSRELAFAGIFGVTTGSSGSTVLGIKYFQNLFYEPHLNFYFTAGLAHLTTRNASGYELLAAMGVEFFFPGLESLGFSMEAGGTYDNATGSYSIKTLGVSFLDAGIHFYF